MNTRELLEKDKEQLKTRLSAASDAEEAAQICEKAVSRILLQYNEQAPSDAARKAASASLTTVRAALSLMDSTGEIQTYERTLPSKKSGAGAWVPLAVGAGFSAAAAFFMTAAPAAMSPVGLVLLIAGLIGVFIGGRNFGKKRGVTPQKEQIIEVHPEPEKICHNLSGLLTVVDQQLEDAQFEEIRAKELPGPVANNSAAIPEEELQLLSGILESAYTRPDDPDAQTTISNIRFYLHKKGIETVEYTEETSRYFNKIPALRTGTLRPAVLQGNTVLVKGLAGSGS
ncbi:MAG: hypothetical protein J5973_04060 [Eubacterium sp.]|nr:hypothetical protein [Eubacterium sp.]